MKRILLVAVCLGGARGIAAEEDVCTIDCDLCAVDTTPPAILCPPDQTVECESQGVAHVDPGVAVSSDVCSAVTINVPGPGVYPFGATPVVYTAVDVQGNAASCVTTITVTSSMPPVLVANAEPKLWPPDHRYVRITPADCGVTLVDPCLGPISAVDAGLHIETVTSDEPEDAAGDGDGDTLADIALVLPTSDKSAGPTDVDLRAERQGGGNGRVYEIRYRLPGGDLVDSSAVTCRVTVPQALPREAVDDGDVYIVSP